MDHREEEFERVAEAQRTTKVEAHEKGIGAAESGAELPARSYPDKTGVADLGVDEPVVLAPPSGDAPRRASDPTGMFAGETEADRREEDAVRGLLEEGFPRTRGNWKESGRAPGARAGGPAPDGPPGRGRS